MCRLTIFLDILSLACMFSGYSQEDLLWFQLGRLASLIDIFDIVTMIIEFFERQLSLSKQFVIKK